MKLLKQDDAENLADSQNNSQTDDIIEGETNMEHSSITPESNRDDTHGASISAREESPKVNKFTKPSTPKRKRAQKQVNQTEDPLLERARQFIQQPNDPTLIYAHHVANKLKKFQGRTRTLVERAINKVIFEAEMGHYDTPAVQMSSLYSPYPNLIPSPTTIAVPLSSPSSSYSSQDSPLSTTMQNISSYYSHSPNLIPPSTTVAPPRISPSSPNSSQRSPLFVKSDYEQSWKTVSQEHENLPSYEAHAPSVQKIMFHKMTCLPSYIRILSCKNNVVFVVTGDFLRGIGFDFQKKNTKI
ncbi:unnamed protein product [Acanthoscelides obtectus]|uniref:Uncharacterized protein n=1 Tax=Acanthoscelides obtectus TaxID=200917 RepID=A0A9P0LA93_ACAOB|nr:unnamed protein product [Acanthoscelides obtectus]CAK1631978.1 hypothetical protein AOBTE_LOCUS7273 [Acanthoscelides obtectus]